MPGSFNPLHEGHLGMMKIVQQKYKTNETYFAISIKNVEKGEIDKESIFERALQFGSERLIITPHGHFSDMSFYMKNTNFVIGYDTYARLFDENFYENEMELVLSAIILSSYETNTKFFVFGRKDPVTGKFMTVKDKPPGKYY